MELWLGSYGEHPITNLPHTIFATYYICHLTLTSELCISYKLLNNNTIPIKVSSIAVLYSCWFCYI